MYIVYLGHESSHLANAELQLLAIFIQIQGSHPLFLYTVFKKKSPFQKELHKKDETPQTLKLN